MAFNKKLTLNGLQYYHTKIKSLFSNINKSISDEISRATNATNIASLQSLVGEGIETISEDSIRALFA